MAIKINIKKLRNFHLYLGVFFAPILLFFLLTGSMQTLGLNHKSRTDPAYHPPKVLVALSQVHAHQRWATGREGPRPSVPFKSFVLLMAAGITVSVFLGILMAFKYTKPWLVWACLAGGIIIPVFFICWSLAAG